MPENKNLPVKKEVVESPMVKLSKALEARRENIAGALSKRMPLAVWMLAAKAAYNKIPSLFECTEDSQFQAWNNAALMGQIPGVDVHWLPFKNKRGFKEVVSVTDYKDICKKAMDSGMVDDLYARVVYVDDEFEVIEGTSPQIIHKPNIKSKNRKDSDIIAFYMVGQMKGHNRPHTDVMANDEVLAVKARSRAGNDGPWVTNYAEMGKKTVIKRGTKTMPRNLFPVEFLQALQAEDQAEFDTVKEADYSVLDVGRRKIGAKKEEPKPEVEGGPEPETGTGKMAPSPSDHPSVDTLKHELKTELAKMNPDESADCLFASGIDSLHECQDPAKLQEALNKARK